jgi:F0F1-type ATP synthase assembly protein I
MAKQNDPRVELDELLAAEFNYIAQTAAQAHEDRARVSSFYLVAVGSLLAGLFSTQLFDAGHLTATVKLMFSGLFTLLTLLGASTVMQLARLRSAWYESMLAMNKIKDFAMNQNPELVNAFLWKTNTLPKKFKTSSVSFYQAIQVAMIGGLMFGAAVFFLQQAYFEVSPLTWIAACIFGLLAVYVQLVMYKRILD